MRRRPPRSTRTDTLFPYTTLFRSGVRVPAENLVGSEGEGFRIAMMGLDGGRLNIGACSLGGAQRCLDEAVNYTRDRKQFGQAIADFQATQFTLADMETELQEIGRASCRERVCQYV